MKNIKSWEITGAILTILIGSLLHFAFQWSGQSPIVAFFGAVNESTWEHLKLAFWPTFIFALIEWFVWGRQAIHPVKHPDNIGIPASQGFNRANFCSASLIKIAVMPVIITALFYGWLLFFKDSLVWDILIFVLAIIVGYYLSYKILISEKDFGFKTLSAFLILIILIAFSLLTYFPPKNLLYKDPISKGYGIEKADIDSNQSKYLNDKYYCQVDSDCIGVCGASINKYYNEKYPIDNTQVACPQVIINSNKCESNKCKAVIDENSPI